MAVITWDELALDVIDRARNALIALKAEAESHGADTAHWQALIDGVTDAGEDFNEGII